MKIYLKSERVNKISDFYNIMNKSAPPRWREEIGSFWQRRLDATSLKFHKDGKRKYVEINTNRAFAAPFIKSTFIERMNVHLALRFINKLSAIRENNELLRRVLNLSIPRNNIKGLTEFGYKVRNRYLNHRFLRGIYGVYNFLLTCHLHSHHIREDVTIMEIGAGIGTNGIIFKELFCDSTYVIVDLPDTLILSSIYLASIFPDAKYYYYSGLNISRKDIEENDFILLPHFAIEKLPSDICGIIWNESSMGEITQDIVNRYFAEMRRIIEPGGLLYNSNRYSKKTNFLDYPYRKNDRHIYQGFDEFHRFSSRFLTKRKFKFIPFAIPSYCYSHPSILMTWITYLEKR